jgi:hypothetical protein
LLVQNAIFPKLEKQKGNLMNSEKKKRKKPYAANLASRKILEERGWMVATVEQTIPYTFIKRDCFNFGDLLCASPSEGIMLVQVTAHYSSSHFHAHVRKITSESKYIIWLDSGGKIQIHTHQKRKGVRGRICKIYSLNTNGETKLLEEI